MSSSQDGNAGERLRATRNRYANRIAKPSMIVVLPSVLFLKSGVSPFTGVTGRQRFPCDLLKRIQRLAGRNARRRFAGRRSGSAKSTSGRRLRRDLGLRDDGFGTREIFQ
jgi:hypothetical protein